MRTIPFRDVYRATMSRIVDVAIAHESGLGTTIPGCPDWTARDVIGHLAGIAEDWVEDRLEGYATPAWTRAQVDRHHADDTTTALRDWAEALERLDRVAAHPLMGEPWRWVAGDALIHEADLYEVLDPERRPPHDAVVEGVASLVARWRHQLAESPGISLRIDVPGVRAWWVGADTHDPVTLHIECDDLWRLLSGRSTRREVEALDWNRAPTAILDHGLPFPFEFRSSESADG